MSTQVQQKEQGPVAQFSGFMDRLKPRLAWWLAKNTI